MSDTKRNWFGRKPKPNPETKQAALANRAALIMAQSLNQNLPRGQKSTDPNVSPFSILSIFEQRLEGYPDASRQQLIARLREVVQNDDDVGGALSDFQALGNTPFTWEIITESDTVREQARLELDAWDENVFTGGLHTLTDNQIIEMVVGGASSVEWVVASDRMGITRAEVVPNEEISARRGRNKAWEYLQTHQGVLNKALPKLTYQYIPSQTSGRLPYGIPTFITTINSLYRRGLLAEGENRIINALKKLAFVMATVTPPDAQTLGVTEGEESPQYEAALRTYMTQMAEVMTNGADNALLVVPEGVKTESQQVTTNAEGADKISQANDRQLWSGLGTLPFMRGKMDSTTQALAQVVYPILLANTAKIMRAIDRQLEHGANLHLRLAGYPAYAKIHREEPYNPFSLDEARARHEDAKAEQILASLYGAPYLQKKAEERGLEYIPIVTQGGEA